MKDGWKYIALSSVCKVQNGYAFDSKLFHDEEKGLPLIRIRDIKRGYSKTYTEETCASVFNVSDGDMLIGMDGDFNIGEWKGGPALLNQRVCKLVPSDKVLAKFIFYFIPEALQKINSKTAFSTVKHLSSKQVESIMLPDLSLSDQQSIVEYLDSSFAKIDAMKTNAEKALNEAKALFQASLKSLLEPKDGWEKKTLLDVIDENSSISYGIVQPGDDVPNGVPVVRPVDLTSKNITLTNQIKRTAKENSDAYRRTILKGKEILLCVRGTTGVISMTDESLKDCNVTRGLVPLRITDDTLRNFLYFALLAPIASDFIQHNTRGAALKQINIADVKLVPVYLPSSNEQQSIVNTLETVENKVIQLQANYDKITTECNALKQALLKQVFE